MITTDRSFECPVCSSFHYKAVAGPERATKGLTYVCACCGFMFGDPRHYRPVLTPYSTLAVQECEGDSRTAAQHAGLMAMMMLQGTKI